jgi:hypothetical protein
MEKHIATRKEDKKPLLVRQRRIGRGLGWVAKHTYKFPDFEHESWEVSDFRKEIISTASLETYGMGRLLMFEIRRLQTF